MKRVIKPLRIVYLIITILLLASCARLEADARPDTGSDIYIAMEDVDARAWTAKLVLHNDSDREIFFGADYSLERQTDGQWKTVPFASDDIAWPAILFVLEPGKTHEWTVAVRKLYGELEKGEYRMVKGYSFDEHYSDDTESAVCEFTIN